MISENSLAELCEKLNQNPRDPGLHFSYGGALAEDGHFDDAVREYQAALKYKPGWLQAQNNLGVVYLEQGRLLDAAGAFDKILQADAQNAEACNNMGVVWAEQGKLEEAADWFHKAVDINPDYQKAQANLEKVLNGPDGSLDEVEVTLFSGEAKAVTESAAPVIAEQEAEIAAQPAEKPPKIPKKTAGRPRKNPGSGRKRPKSKNRMENESCGKIIGLLKYLKDLAGALCENKQEAFMKSGIRLSMEYIINTLEGKKGLLKEIRERIPGAAVEPPAGAAEEQKIAKTLSYLGNLTTTLPDDEISSILRQKAENIITLIQDGGKKNDG